MPKAARISDYHTCPAVNPGPVPHVGGPVSSGSPDVNIGYIPAARVGDTAVCVPAVDSIAAGSANVFVNHRKAARIGDGMAHGGKIVAGCASVNIGSTAQRSALLSAAKNGAPFCEECEKARRKNEELRAPAPSFEAPVHSVAPVAAPASPVDSQKPEVAAKKPNAEPDDGFNPQRNAAREKVVWDFLAAEGLAAPDIESHLGNIDISKPLEVITLLPAAASELAGAALSAIGFAADNNALGSYLSPDAAASPAALGVSPSMPSSEAGALSGPALPRKPRVLPVDLETPQRALKSVSANSGKTQLIVPKAL